MRKIKGIVHEQWIDAVLRYLSGTDIVHLPDLRGKLVNFEGILEPYSNINELSNRLNALLLRTSSALTKTYEVVEDPGTDIERFSLQVLPYSKTEDIVNELDRKLRDLSEELESELGNLTNVSSENKQILLTNIGRIQEQLLIIKSTIQREATLLETKLYLGKTEHTIYFEIFVPKFQVNNIIRGIKEVAESNCVLSEEDPSDSEETPRILQPIPEYLKVFEKLVLAFGYPSFGEINPSSLMAITFPLLFGIMFADVAQGLLLVAFGLMFSYIRKRDMKKEYGDILNYILMSGEMLVFCGISSSFFGLLFGEAFGPSGLIHPLSLGKIGPFYLGGFEPMHEPMKMMRFALLIGVIHISSGIVIRIINDYRTHHFKKIPVDFCWLWLLFGGLFMWSFWGGVSNIPLWFVEGLPMMLVSIVLPLALIILFSSIAERSLDGIGFGLEVFTETLSHSLSYCRLMALGLVHSVMNYIFLILGGVSHGNFPLTSIPIMIIGTIIVMSLEGLLIFIHTLRLHWVEWFSKFYTGRGIPFKPLKL